jgi:hypothetical protein
MKITVERESGATATREISLPAQDTAAYQRALDDAAEWVRDQLSSQPPTSSPPT